MKIIARDQIIETLAVSIRGATPATLITETDARLLKTGNNLGKVNKLSKVNVILNFIYEKSVQRQQVREGATEGTFEAQEHQWAQHVEGCRWLVTNPKTGEWYIVGKVEKSLEKPTYINADTRAVLDYEAVKPFIPAKKSNAEKQGVDKEIIYRNWKLASVKEIHVDGEQYVIVPEAAAVEAVTVPAPQEEAVETPQPQH